MEPPPLLDRPFDRNALALMSAEVAKHFHTLPIALEGSGKILVAWADPSVSEDIQALTNREVEGILYPPEDILNAIEFLYDTRPPEPESKVDPEGPSVELDPIHDRFLEALRRRPAICPDVYHLVEGEADVATLLVDEFLSEGTTSQARLYWGIDGIFEEREGRIYRTGTPPEKHFPDCLARLRIVAGLPRGSRGPAHCRFEIDTGRWRFVVYAAFLDDAALVEFHPRGD